MRRHSRRRPVSGWVDGFGEDVPQETGAGVPFVFGASVERFNDGGIDPGVNLR
jgi:hypothetical protein